MSSRRFELILRFLHLNDTSSAPARGEQGYDKLHKVRPFLDILLTNFRNKYVPNQQISIDESMISFKGRLSFIQYLPKKPHKWGMKAWVLADSINGYTWGWHLYTGKEGEGAQPVKGLAHRVVMGLVDNEQLKQKGYIVYTDNFYSSPALFRELLQAGFGAVGTVRKDRRGIPAAVRSTVLQRGGVVSVRDDSVLCLKWKDKRDVMLLSTYHDDRMMTKSRRSRATRGSVEDDSETCSCRRVQPIHGGVDKSKYSKSMPQVI